MSDTPLKPPPASSCCTTTTTCARAALEQTQLCAGQQCGGPQHTSSRHMRPCARTRHVRSRRACTHTPKHTRMQAPAWLPRGSGRTRPPHPARCLCAPRARRARPRSTQGPACARMGRHTVCLWLSPYLCCTLQGQWHLLASANMTAVCLCLQCKQRKAMHVRVATSELGQGKPGTRGRSLGVGWDRSLPA